MAIDGLLLVDKPDGLTSHDVVARLRRALGQKSVGHTGTLDPLATGLMGIVLGEATKLSDYLIAADKAYLVRVRFGLTTDTLDRTGQILTEQPVRLAADQIQAAVEDLQGEFEWPVPAYSAAKIDGRKLYEYARSEREIEAPVKEMRFWDARVRESGADFVSVSLACSKGSYIRSWAAELGRVLGCGGIVDQLRRTRVGVWSVDQALTLEEIERRRTAVTESPAFLGMGQALPGLKAVIAGPREARLMGHGQIPRDLGARLMFEQKQAIAHGAPVFVKVLSGQGELLAILAAEPRQGLKIRRVFRSFP